MSEIPQYSEEDMKIHAQSKGTEIVNDPCYENNELRAEKSAEELEMENFALEKVQNIRKSGVAFTEITKVIKNENDFEKKLKSILKYGLLGTSSKNQEDFWREGADVKKSWGKNVREKESLVYFNIVGRTSPTIEYSYYMQRRYKFPQVAIIFDLSRFNEVPFQNPDGSWKETFGHHTYSLNYPDETSTFGPSEWGFALSSRVSPKDLRGIVSTDPSIDDKILEIQKEIFKDKKELILPIYNEVGELTWPKYMTRWQVSEFDAEKSDKKKENEDEKKL